MAPQGVQQSHNSRQQYQFEQSTFLTVPFLVQNDITKIADAIIMKLLPFYCNIFIYIYVNFVGKSSYVKNYARIVMSKQKWEEKKTSLGNAIIMSAVMLVAGIFVGVNCNNWFSGFAPYLGIQGNVSSDVDWSPLNEVYNKLATTYNGEISKEEIVEGAKKGLVESLGDIYTVFTRKCGVWYWRRDGAA